MPQLRQVFLFDLVLLGLALSRLGDDELRQQLVDRLVRRHGHARLEGVLVAQMNLALDPVLDRDLVHHRWLVAMIAFLWVHRLT
ncbi:MAG: hypothetical protein ACYTA3_10180 [Planctomycetota bacterium]